MAKLPPGKCKTTKNGMKLCHIPGVGVRFTGKAGSAGKGRRRSSLSGAGESCKRFKRVKVKGGRGKTVRRCAAFK